MAKSASPVRLQSCLMQMAAIDGAILHRSAAEQIEYWADLGRKVSKLLTPETLLEVQAGLTTIEAIPRNTQPVNSAEVFRSLQNSRQSGAISEAINSGEVRYQASNAHPGMLEACYPDGRIEVGQFEGGIFQRD